MVGMSSLLQGMVSARKWEVKGQSAYVDPMLNVYQYLLAIDTKGKAHHDAIYMYVNKYDVERKIPSYASELVTKDKEMVTC